jgi:Family of unknown function (DUF6335)
MKDDSTTVLEIDDTREFVRELHEHSHRDSACGPQLSGGDIDARWDQAEAAGEETACASASTPDQNVVEDIGEALGIVYQPGEALKIGEKEEKRDRQRWELDPASAEDYGERSRGHDLSEPFLHMTHSGHRPHRE